MAFFALRFVANCLRAALSKVLCAPERAVSLTAPAGFEPAIIGTKIRCLTIWRRGIICADRLERSPPTLRRCAVLLHHTQICYLWRPTSLLRSPARQAVKQALFLSPANNRNGRNRTFNHWLIRPLHNRCASFRFCALYPFSLSRTQATASRLVGIAFQSFQSSDKTRLPRVRFPPLLSVTASLALPVNSSLAVNISFHLFGKPPPNCDNSPAFTVQDGLQLPVLLCCLPRLPRARICTLQDLNHVKWPS